MVQDKLNQAKENRTDIGFVSIDYSDGDQLTYKGYKIDNGKHEKLRIFTGDFIIDSLLLKLFIESSLKSKCFHWSCSSSMNHFFSDGNLFKKVYVQWNSESTDFNIKPTEEIEMSKIEKYDQIVLGQNMNSFKEYSEYIKKWKEKNLKFYNNWKEEMGII